jgi:hypothetical protein
MFTNMQNKGVQSQLDLYGPNGRAVVAAGDAVLKAGGTSDEAVAAMTAKIYDQLAADPDAWRNGHLADPSVRGVYDIAPSSIPAGQRQPFAEYLRKDPRVAREFDPWNSNDPAIHIEVPLP